MTITSLIFFFCFLTVAVHYGVSDVYAPLYCSDQDQFIIIIKICRLNEQLRFV